MPFTAIALTGCRRASFQFIAFYSIMGRSSLLASALVGTCLPGIALSFVKVAPPGTSAVASQERRASFVTTAAPRVPRDRQRYRHQLQAKKKKSDSGRPSLDDVERLSRGQAAKKRGTGSRGVCHRLNESERKVCVHVSRAPYVCSCQVSTKSNPRTLRCLHRCALRQYICSAVVPTVSLS